MQVEWKGNTPTRSLPMSYSISYTFSLCGPLACTSLTCRDRTPKGRKVRKYEKCKLEMLWNNFQPDKVHRCIITIKERRERVFCIQTDTIGCTLSRVKCGQDHER